MKRFLFSISTITMTYDIYLEGGTLPFITSEGEFIWLKKKIP